MLGGRLQLERRARSLAAAAVQRTWAFVGRVGSVGPDDAPARRFGAFGPGSLLAFPTGALFGERSIRIGAGTLVCPHVSMSAGMAEGQPLPCDPVIAIGDRCTIGRGSHVVGHRTITIGDDVVTGPYVYITDQEHVYADPDRPVGRQWPSEAAVHIGPGCWIGTGAVVLPGTTLGRNVVVAAGSVVRGEVPDHCVVAGAPAKVVRRRVDGEWDPPLRDVFIDVPPDYVG